LLADALLRFKSTSANFHPLKELTANPFGSESSSPIREAPQHLERAILNPDAIRILPTVLSKRYPRRIPHSFFIRAVYSFVAIVVVNAIGIVGMHALEGLSYLDSFYFTAMLSTGEGPAFTPVTVAGKLFAGVLSFVAVGTVITALLFLFGPFFGQVIRVGIEKVEEEAEKEKEKIEKRD